MIYCGAVKMVCECKSNIFIVGEPVDMDIGAVNQLIRHCCGEPVDMIVVVNQLK